MKYNPKKLTYDDALRIATANMTVTVEDENRQHVTGKLKHIGPNDALAGDNLALRDLILLALITTSNEYFVVRDDDERILCPAIRFDRDLNVTWNTIISIEENPDDGKELDFSEWKTELVKQETPEDGTSMDASYEKAKEWESELPKANGIYRSATGSVWLHSGDTWTPILNRHGNIPPKALQQSNLEFAISSHKAHRWPFEREVEKKLPTRPGFYRNKDKTNLYHLDSSGVWKLIAYMCPDFDLQLKDPWDCPSVPVLSGEVVSEKQVRNDMPLHYYKLGLKQPKEDKENS